MPRDSRQALRCRRILMALLAYAMWMVLGAYLLSVGLLRIGFEDLLLYWAAILGANLFFFTLVRTGLNRRFTDPSMTFVQIAISIIFAVWFVAAVEPAARGVSLLLFVSGLFFGVFRLTTREFFSLAFFAVGLYAALVIWEAPLLSGRDLQVQVAQVVVLGAVLFWLAFMGGYVARLRAELRHAVRRIDTLAHTDALTGAENRRSITGTLEQAIAEAGRRKTPLAVCLLDIDHFKKVNDLHGHSVGDDVLREFVDRVESTLRSGDLVGIGRWPGSLGRFGGEEFLVLFRGTDGAGARLAAERIRKGIADRPFETGAGAVDITVSLGVAEWAEGEEEVDLLRRADRALYEAKQEGRNRVCIAAVPGVKATGPDGQERSA